MALQGTNTTRGQGKLRAQARAQPQATKQTPGKYESWVLGLWLAWEGN